MKYYLLVFTFFISSFASAINIIVDNDNSNASHKSGFRYFKSIQTAIDSANEGDTIFISRGNYYENLLIKNKKYLVLTTLDSNKVVINGSTNVTINQNNEHSFLSSRRRSILFYQKISINEFENTMDDDYPFVYDKSDNAIWVYKNKNRFNSNYISSKNGAGACFIKNEMLLHSDLLNNSSSVQLSRKGHVVQIINCENIVIDGKNNLDIKNGSRRNVFISGAKSDPNSYVLVKRLNVTNSKIGITVSNTSNRIIVEENTINFLGNIKWTWHEIKNCHSFKPKLSYCISLFETLGILTSGNNSEVIIQNNEILGHFNGIVVLSNNVKVINNDIHNIKDDGIELEGNIGNIEIYNNFLYDCFRSISISPVSKGPVYVFNNVISQSKEKFLFKYNEVKEKLEYEVSKTLKIQSQPMFKKGKTHKTRNIHFYQNTFYSKENTFTIGTNKKKMLPVDCSFVNNCFVTEDEPTEIYFAQDDSLTLLNNLFVVVNDNHSSKKIRKKNTFIYYKYSDFLDFNPFARESFILSDKTKKKLTSFKYPLNTTFPKVNISKSYYPGWNNDYF